MKKYLKQYYPVIPGVIVFSLFCYLLNFTQDDAFISYRYVANFLNGNGLVFNIGERVEGFTNFGWVMYMIFWGKLGLNYIIISKITGYLFGLGIITLTFLLAHELFDNKKISLITLLAVLLVSINQSLAYWSVSGLETSAFAFMTLWSIYLYLKRSRLLILSLFLAVFIRPEGAFVTGLLIGIEWITEKRFPKYTLSCALVAFILSLPYIGFKLFYYGSIIPNPFYAKTGFNMTQLQNGLEYSGRFFRHYGLYGVPLLIPLLFYKKFSKTLLTIWLFTAVYIIYITLIGGDVLKVHRFYLPIFGLYALLTVYSLSLIIKKLSAQKKQIVVVVVGVALLGLTYYLPNKFVKDYNRLERRFIDKMAFLANNLNEYDQSNFSVALPTIGVFGYTLLGHRIIDMLGLTDSTIARHSDPPIPGMESTWKEGKHNTTYILTEKPNYIMFSTGIKPSAPAEKALLLYPRFLQSYYEIGWYYKPDYAINGTVWIIYKEKDTLKGEIKPTYPLSFVDDYKLGLESYIAGDQKGAIRYYERALKESPEPKYIYLQYQRAFSYYLLRDHDKAMMLLDSVIYQDSMVFLAHRDLYLYARLMHNDQKAEIHRRWLKKLVPKYFNRIDSNITAMIEQANRRLQKR